MESLPDKVDKVVTLLENIRDLLEIIIKQDINEKVVKLILDDTIGDKK